MAGIYYIFLYVKSSVFIVISITLFQLETIQHLLMRLLRKLSLRKDYLGNETVSTIYFGGGTPSVLSVRGAWILFLIRSENIYRVEENCEITVELNPDDVNPDYLAGLKKLNINRISLGIQSWRDADLKMLNRRHDSHRQKELLKEIFNAGFENVSIDLIYGIPGMSLEEWASNLDFSFSFDIKHLSAYHLTFETGNCIRKDA